MKYDWLANVINTVYLYWSGSLQRPQSVVSMCLCVCCICVSAPVYAICVVPSEASKSHQNPLNLKLKVPDVHSANLTSVLWKINSIFKQWPSSLALFPFKLKSHRALKKVSAPSSDYKSPYTIWIGKGEYIQDKEVKRSEIFSSLPWGPNAICQTL